MPYKQAIWDNIFDEYTELNPDKKQQQTYLLVKEINYLQNKLYLIQSCVKILETRANSDIIDILRKYGYRNTNDLPGIITQSKVLTLQIRDKKAELEKLQSKTGKEKALTESDFDETLAILGDSFGFKIDPHIETVSSYCKWLKLHSEKVANATAGTNKRGSW